MVIVVSYGIFLSNRSQFRPVAVPLGRDLIHADKCSVQTTGNFGILTEDIRSKPCISAYYSQNFRAHKAIDA